MNYEEGGEYFKLVKQWLEGNPINTFGHKLGDCLLTITVDSSGRFKDVVDVKCGGQEMGAVIYRRLASVLSEMPDSIRYTGSFRMLEIKGVRIDG